MLDAGAMVDAFAVRIQQKIDHARKHLAQAEGQLLIIREGEGIDQRMKASNQLSTHLSIVASDMEAAKLDI